MGEVVRRGLIDLDRPGRWPMGCFKAQVQLDVSLPVWIRGVDKWG